MSMTNHERVGRGLELLREALLPFVRRELLASYGARWKEEALRGLNREGGLAEREGELHLDVHALLAIMWQQWNDVFGRVLSHAERTLVSELRDVRNRWAHQRPFSTDDAYRALDSMARLLTAISAPEARELEQMKQELLRIRFEEQARRQSRRAAVAPTEGQPLAGLKPWREVVTPHPDVASGRYQSSEFAANLAAVHRGEAAEEYQDPREFFRRTFITEGLQHLLRNALRRLTGQGGDSVVELQTNFGGGKTHSMLALYHLCSTRTPAELPGLEGLLEEVGVMRLPEVKRAVLVGTDLSPARPVRHPDGTDVRTMWGHLAWQIGGREGYEFVAEADARGVSPGADALRQLFARFAPCLVLIDEWLPYIRQLYGVSDLPGGSFDANLTFAQALTEAAAQAPQTLLVASLPASDIEIGGEAGREALRRLQNIFSRVELTWKPASAEEGFEIVRRRLFQPISDPQLFVHRDAVVQAFARMYREQAKEFPASTQEAGYVRRLQAAYPIHPELFDRLYGAWSSLDRFQRTRGVLRLMAAVIHSLWEREDRSLLIMPGTIPIDDPAVQQELTRYLEDNWQPVIERDVDGPQSLPLRMDRELPNLGRYSAARRVARTIYMGSAPTVNAAHPGIDEASIKLGCTQPGEHPAIFGDALRRLTDHATHLYVDGNRYWYSTQPSVTREAEYRASQLDIHEVWEELRQRLRADRTRGDFAAVHAAPESSAEVPDEMEVRLVILGPEHPHAAHDPESPARREAAAILTQRGPSPRQYQNMLVFLAPDRPRLGELEQAIRQYLAWRSIERDQEVLNLTAFQANQASTKRLQADETVKVRIQETYTWLLIPTQPDPMGPVEWDEIRLQGKDPLTVRASKRLRHEEHLITELAPTRLRLEMDRYLWKNRDHLELKKLWEYFATYLYLPRLRDEQVLRKAVEQGISQLVWSDTFAYAEGWDEARQRYVGLRAGEGGQVIIDNRSLLVKPDVAARQLERERVAPVVANGGGEGPDRDATGTGGDGHGRGSEGGGGQPSPVILKRFHATVRLDPLRLSRQAGDISREVIAHLNSLLGAEVELYLEISATAPDGYPEHVVRTVLENCRTLKFDNYVFEQE